MRIERLKKTNSTNEYVKKFIKNKEDVIVVADEQTGGMGTKGRSFISEKGGLYFTKLSFYNNFPASESWQIMAGAALAVVKTLLAFGIQAKIKWPNDIIVNGKKICGILISNSFCSQNIDYSIVGIGLNVNNEIAEEIKDIAISTKQVLGKELDIESLLLTLSLNLSAKADINEYRAYSAVIGKKLTVIRGENIFESVAVDILPDGALKLENGELLYAGELNLKIKI
ncbi:MAG: biotin--[Clostridia bacterium]|nr:biotin--[acetyl-CoA-carboxylase] ligase [Clostridia bacterium]